jgi:hypothetical protein
VAKTHNKITMEKLGQDHLGVHEFHRKGLLRDREVVIKPLRVSRQALGGANWSVSATDPAILDALSFRRISPLV